MSQGLGMEHRLPDVTLLYDVLNFRLFNPWTF